MLIPTLELLLQRNGGEHIGAGQRTIAYTVIADGGNGQLLVTANGHGLLKTQSIFFTSGAGYAGSSFKVTEVVGANQFRCRGDVAFSATAAGNINLVVCLEGHGFIVNDATGLVIDEFVPDDPTVDVVAFKAKAFQNNELVPIPFKKLRVSVGKVTAVKRPPRAALTYTNR